MKKMLIVLALICLVSCEEAEKSGNSCGVVTEVENNGKGWCTFTIKHVRPGYIPNYGFEMHPCDWAIAGDTLYLNN